MCQAIPRKVLAIDANAARAEVDLDGQPTWIQTVALPDVEVGEYVVVYAGQALERIPEAEALEMLAFYAQMEDMLEEANA